MKYRISGKSAIDKDYVLRKIGQLQIWNRYFGQRVRLGKYYTNPLRDDKKPGCRFYSINNNIIFIDFAGYFKGNCIDFVMEMYGLNFREALLRIANDFNLDLSSQPTSTVAKATKAKVVKKAGFQPQEYKKVSSFIGVKKRPWNQMDLMYWNQFGITMATLMRYHVVPIQKVFYRTNEMAELNFDELIVYQYESDDPAYGYWLGTDQDKNEEWKIYYPMRSGDQVRFMSNNFKLQGYSQLPDKSETLWLTKALKDVMVFATVGIPAVAPSNEKPISKRMADELQQRFDRIITLYDFDYTGIRAANWMHREYGFERVFLTNGSFGFPDEGAKDPAEYVAQFGLYKGVHMLDAAINRLNRIVI